MQLSIRLDGELLARLEKLSKQTGRSKTYYVREALIEKMEDLEDTYMAKRVLARVKSGKAKILTQEEVKAKYGL